MTTKATVLGLYFFLRMCRLVFHHLQMILLSHARSLLEKIFKPGYHYKRAGVLFSGLIQESVQQFSVGQPNPITTSGKKLMHTVDEVCCHGGTQPTPMLRRAGRCKLWDEI